MDSISYGSVCSGIEAATAAWHTMGWQAAWFAEIEPFPSAILAHHYPDVPNLGDMTAIASKILSGAVPAPDILVGGTPCQAFSVAGLRGGLNDPRGALTLSFVELANAIDKRRSDNGEPYGVVVWENVPGVLSSKDNAFGCFLAGLAGEDSELKPSGKKWSNAGCVFGPQRAVAWRVLDAQYFGVAQRRRRVFVVASARDGFDPCQILFEFDGLRRDSAPSREKGEEVTFDTAPCLTSSGRGVERTGDSRGQDPVVAVALRGRCGGSAAELGDEVAFTLRASSGGSDKPHILSFGGGNTSGPIEVATTLNTRDRVDFESETFVCQGYHSTGAGYWQEGAGTLRAREQDSHENIVCITGDITPTLKAEGFDDSEDGTGRGQPIVAVRGTQDPCTSEHTAFAQNTRDEVRLVNGDGMIVGALAAEPGMKQTSYIMQPNMRVRRLTPKECERLQGFPDSYTNVPQKVKTLNPIGSGPCAKQVVMATLVTHTGKMFSATNHCLTPVSECPRKGMVTGEGYELCKTVCNQPNHAEVNVVELAGKEAEGATLYLEGHTYACKSCIGVATSAGVREVIIGRPPGNAADGPRYKAIGNSMAVPCMAWIGNRINSALKQ